MNHIIKRACLLVRVFFFAVASATAAIAFAAETQPSSGVGQLGQATSWVSVPGSPDLFFQAQRSRDGRLILTPNEAFFPKLGLSATGIGTVPDQNNLNGSKTFATIQGWDAGDVAEWGLLLAKPGTVSVQVFLSSQDSKDRFRMSLAGTEQTLKPNGSFGEPVSAETMTFTVPKAGQHVLRLACDKGSAGSRLHWIDVSGDAVVGGAVLRKRWRPAAAHTKFSSSQIDRPVRMWVMEMDAVPGELGFYAPITTPFGYYGPTWQADGTVNTSFNFSLWSFKRGQPQPAVQQLSHLLAIGNRHATFGGFDHEGTGVKIRDWEPLAGRQGQRQVFALRVQPGDRYDTYFSYFYQADTQRWRLFGVGNKFNAGKPIDSLVVGSFVEVPGPPHVQRTGPYQRVMRYRGWVMDQAGNWHPLDRMSNGNADRKTGLTHTDRGLTDDGWFYLQTGGWTYRKAATDRYVQVDQQPQRQMPSYLSNEDVAYLKGVPSTITATIVERVAHHLRGTFRVRNVGKNASVRMFWGPTEGLTFADRWQNETLLTSPREGDNTFVIDAVDGEETVRVRMLLTNDEGQFWTTQTIAAAPNRN
ncbi:hypothetical protein K227x_23890 [Rubripirellula lacrimiformis]|uniref:Uncharacterized protein n=1 Tax=Rubripirellula lacrimiformis TaxID=1930273 RepID=A0A517NA43_9BACT|nr:DUF3472 domain-containing protein [Rubripirellula lacrimiformis]QDT04003.1 hypothetical protein K227x_23890 [Rubripirellula lacrimiformis]